MRISSLCEGILFSRLKLPHKAFSKLLTDLYSDDILNINSEIEVMNTLLSQDGLIEKNTMFKRGAE